MSRKFDPLKADHPLIGKTCPACQELFKEGDVTTLIPLGPGDDSKARAAARAKKTYNAIAMPIHWACATGEEE